MRSLSSCQISWLYEGRTCDFVCWFVFPIPCVFKLCCPFFLCQIVLSYRVIAPALHVLCVFDPVPCISTGVLPHVLSARFKVITFLPTFCLIKGLGLFPHELLCFLKSNPPRCVERYFFFLFFMGFFQLLRSFDSFIYISD